MNIRKAVKEDIAILESLNNKFFHEEGRDWEKLISSGKSEMFVLEDGSKILGFS